MGPYSTWGGLRHLLSGLVGELCITVIDVGLFLLPAAFCFSLSSVYCWEIVYIKTFRFKTLGSIE